MSKKLDDEARAPRWGPGRFGWAQRRVAGAVVVELAGELDLSTAAELRRRLMTVAESGTAARIVLDLSDVSFIDAQSAGLIMDAWTAAKFRDRELCVDGLHGIPARVFGLLGLESVLARCMMAADHGGMVDGRRGGTGGGAVRECPVGAARETR